MPQTRRIRRVVGCLFAYAAFAGLSAAHGQTSQKADPPQTGRTSDGRPAAAARAFHKQAGQGLPSIPKPTVVLKPGEAPKATFESPELDFGRVRGGAVITHDFRFTNTGTGPLEIVAVRPSCGCTTAGDFDKIVRPGQSGKIPIRLETEKFSGNLSKSVTIHTNVSGSEGTITLRLYGEVWRALDVKPRKASFGRVMNDHEQVRRLTIINNTDQTPHLTDIRSTNPVFRATIRAIDSPKRFELIVTAVPPFKDGRNSGRITLSTGIADLPTLDVFVSAYRAPPVDVRPRRVRIPAESGDEPLVRKLFVRNQNRSRPLHLTHVRVSNPAIRIRLIEQQPGIAFQIVLRFPAGYLPPPAGDRVTFNPDEPTTPEVSIPIEASGAAARGGNGGQ